MWFHVIYDTFSSDVSSLNLHTYILKFLFESVVSAHNYSERLKSLRLMPLCAGK